MLIPSCFIPLDFVLLKPNVVPSIFLTVDALNQIGFKEVWGWLIA
jgi:hypothetical protein